MYTAESFLSMITCLAVISAIVYAILGKLKVKASNVKIMLLGIALIAFSNSVLKGMVKYDVDVMLSLVGLSFCLVGFFKRDKWTQIS